MGMSRSARGTQLFGAGLPIAGSLVKQGTSPGRALLDPLNLFPKAPPVPKPVNELKNPDEAGLMTRRRNQSSAGFGSTMATGPSGLTSRATTAQKTLLG